MAEEKRENKKPSNTNKKTDSMPHNETQNKPKNKNGYYYKKNNVYKKNNQGQNEKGNTDYKKKNINNEENTSSKQNKTNNNHSFEKKEKPYKKDKVEKEINRQSDVIEEFNQGEQVIPEQPIVEQPLPPIMRREKIETPDTILPPIRKTTIEPPLKDSLNITNEPEKIVEDKEFITSIIDEAISDYEEENLDNGIKEEPESISEEPVYFESLNEEILEPVQKPLKPIMPKEDIQPKLEQSKSVDKPKATKTSSKANSKSSKKSKSSTLGRNLIIWGIVLIIIGGFLAFYFSSKTPTKVEEPKDPKTIYENLLEMDYEVVDYQETADGIVLKLKGAFRDSDIISYQNKLINLVKKQNVTVYYFENSAINYDFLGANTPDLIAYTETNFNDFNMKFNKYQELPNIEASQTLNKYNLGEINSDDGILTITMEMDVDVEDLSSVVSNAKAFIDLFKRTNNDKNIEDVKLNLVVDDTLVYSYNTQEPNYLMIQEIKTFSKQ